MNPVHVSPAQSGGLAPLVARRDPAREPSVKVSTPWVSFPGLYTAQCVQGAAGRSWLQVTSDAVPGRTTTVVSDNPVARASIGATTWTT